MSSNTGAGTVGAGGADSAPPADDSAKAKAPTFDGEGADAMATIDGGAAARAEPPLPVNGSTPGTSADPAAAAAAPAVAGGAPAAAAPNSLLAARKRSPPEGTWEEPDVAFQLFLAPGPPPSIFPFAAYPFLAAPSLGVYSEAYDASPPIALLTLPPRCALELPEVAPLLREVVKRGLLPPGPDLTGLDVLVQVHGGLALPQQCAVHGCGSSRHVNLVLHPWAFAHDGVEADPGVHITAEVHVGVFHASPGVRPAHLSDFEKAGLPFGKLSKRVVLLHDGRFSPNNCQLSVASGVEGPGRDHPDVATFVSLAVDGELRRGVLTLHAVPLGDGPADWARGWLRGRSTLRELLDGMRAHAPHLFELTASMLLPALPPAEADVIAAELKAVGERLDAAYVAAQETAYLAAQEAAGVAAYMEGAAPGAADYPHAPAAHTSTAAHGNER